MPGDRSEMTNDLRKTGMFITTTEQETTTDGRIKRMKILTASYRSVNERPGEFAGGVREGVTSGVSMGAALPTSGVGVSEFAGAVREGVTSGVSMGALPTSGVGVTRSPAEKFHCFTQVVGLDA